MFRFYSSSGVVSYWAMLSTTRFTLEIVASLLVLNELRVGFPPRFQRCYFFDKAPSFEAREAHRCLNNWLGIFCARGGGLLDHPYAPCHPPSATPTEKHLGVISYTTGIRWVVAFYTYILFPIGFFVQYNKSSIRCFWICPHEYLLPKALWV